MRARPSFWSVFALACSWGLATYGPEWLVLIAFVAVLGLVELSEEQKRQKGGRIREALRAIDLSITKAAWTMGRMDPSDLEKALNGLRKMDVWRLEMLPIEFHQELWLLEARDRGLPERALTFLRILPAIAGMPADRRTA